MDPTDIAVPTEAPEAPVADQPEAPVVEAPASGTSPEDTPTPETPEAEAPASDDESFTDLDPESLSEDAREPYKRMQADYTRKTQALAERHAELDQAVTFIGDLVSDEPSDEQKATQESVFRVLAERLGYDVEDTGDEPTPEADEPTDVFHDPRLDPILAEREQQAESARQAEYEQTLDTAEKDITDGIAALAKKDGHELTEPEADLIFDHVLARPAVNGGPDIAGAYAKWTAGMKAYVDRWVKTKGVTVPPEGQAPEEPVDLHDEESRHRFMANRIEAARRAESGL